MVGFKNQRHRDERRPAKHRNPRLHLIDARIGNALHHNRAQRADKCRADHQHQPDALIDNGRVKTDNHDATKSHGNAGPAAPADLLA